MTMQRRMTRRWIAAAILAASTSGATVDAGPSPARMATAATEFLKSLTPEQRQQATFSFDGDERTHWHFVPTEIFARHGLTLKQMNPSQQALARALLKQRVDVYAGYMADDIAADRLARIEKAGWYKVAFAWAGLLREHVHDTPHRD